MSLAVFYEAPDEQMWSVAQIAPGPDSNQLHFSLKDMVVGVNLPVRRHL